MITISEANGILSQLDSADRIQKISRRVFDSQIVQVIDCELVNCTVAEARLFLVEAENEEGNESHVLLVV